MPTLTLWNWRRWFNLRTAIWVLIATFFFTLFQLAIPKTSLPKANAAEVIVYSAMNNGNCASQYSNTTIYNHRIISGGGTIGKIRIVIGSTNRSNWASNFLQVRADSSSGLPGAVLATFSASSISGNIVTFTGSYTSTVGTKFWVNLWTSNSTTRVYRCYYGPGTTGITQARGFTRDPASGSNWSYAYSYGDNFSSWWGAGTGASFHFTLELVLSGLTPEFGTPTFSPGATAGSPGSWTIPITNFDASYNWSYSASNGATVDSSAAAVGSTKNIKVTPLSNTSATLTVNTSKTGEENGTATTSSYFGGCNRTSATSSGITTIALTSSGTDGSGTCSWAVPTGITRIKTLVVAGGGGGGGTYWAGGGGAGGVVYHPNYTVASGTIYSVAIGAGGAAGTNSAATSKGSNGGNSSLDSTLIANGGGGGGGYGWGTTSYGQGLAGGSGGGVGEAQTTLTGGSSNQSAITGATVHGFKGGDLSFTTG